MRGMEPVAARGVLWSVGRHVWRVNATGSVGRHVRHRRGGGGDIDWRKTTPSWEIAHVRRTRSDLTKFDKSACVFA